MKLRLIFPLFCLILFFSGTAQMRQVYLDNVADNQIKKISFYKESEGYVAFRDWIGYTQDSGRTFTKKYITLGNVDYNNYQVNLTFGFAIYGVHAFNKDTIIAYGHYGFIPAILYSSDQGNTFKLIFHSSYNTQPQLNDGIKQMIFPQNNNIGFAIDGYRVLKTTNSGLSWSVLRNEAVDDLQFLNANTGFITGSNKILKTVTSGAAWTSLTVPAEEIRSSFFLTENKGWINTLKDGNGKVYYTGNGGVTWTLMSSTAYSSVISSKLNFTNDSTGYAIGELFTVYKSTDTGRVWERLERLNNYEYLYYSHNDIFFSTADHFWAGGGHGYLEMSTNGGGSTYPDARFLVDVSLINTNNTVKLNNLSKMGYSYQWIKNNVLLSTSYNTSYVSNRLSFDTIKLIVTKGGLSDTAEQIVDTRIDQTPCNGSFSYLVDTSSVKFTSGYTAYGVKHYWTFGDGAMDSITVNPIHAYTAIGNFTVKHVVKNTITGCKDSVSQSIQVVRLTKCLQVDIVNTADTFFTNRLTFDFVQRPGTDLINRPVSAINWNFGDGISSSNGKHTFDSSKYYNITLTLTHQVTGCITKVVQPVFVFMENGCNADFKVYAKTDPSGVAFSGDAIRFYNKPVVPNNTITNTWIFYNNDTVRTGNVPYMSKLFYTIGTNGVYFDISGNSCNTNETYEFDLDKITRRVKHLVTNGATGCIDEDSSFFTVPTLKKIYIYPVPDSAFPNLVTFYAYQDNGYSTYPYSSRWRTSDGYEGGWIGSYSSIKRLYTGGTYNIAVASPSCGAGNRREVYSINYVSPPLAPCALYPPEFTYAIDSAQPSLLSFSIPNNVVDVNSSLGWKRVLYFGTGDSSLAASGTYNFSSPGVYTVKLRFTNNAGCVQEMVKQVTISATCNVTAAFSAVQNGINSLSFSFNNRTTPDLTTIQYKWYFGNGDSSTVKSPAYNYLNAGRYTVRLVATRSATCISIKDTIIVIMPLCTLSPAFTFTRNSQNPAIITFTNLTSPDSSNQTYKWYFGNGDSSVVKNPVYTYPAPGSFKVILIAKRGLCSAAIDSTILIPNQVVTITSFLPQTGTIGTIVTITGDNFNLTPSQNIVYFGAAKAMVISATLNTLTVVAPAGVTYEPITVTTNNRVAYSQKPFIVTFAGGSAFTSNSFTQKIDSSTGPNPVGVAICDYDEDGKADLSVASLYNSMSVRKNNSSGETLSFSAGIGYGTSGTVRAIKYADFDGDGKKDIVVPIEHDFYGASIFRNTSTGSTISFDQELRISLSALGGFVVTTGDFDGDGKVDLAILSQYTNRLSVFKNSSSNGTISFEPPLTYTTNSPPRWVEAGDMDGDGKTDLIVSNGSSSLVSVYRNTSSYYKISFAAKVDFFSAAASNFVIGDLDADNKPEIIITNGGSSAISILKNTSQNGVISFNPKIDYSTGVYPVAAALADLDGDGKPDIVVANRDSSRISVYKNQSTNGTILFSAKVNYATGSGPSSLAIADLNGDGKPDIAVANSNASTVSILRNRVNEPNRVMVCPFTATILSANLSGNLYTWQWDTCRTGSCYQNIVAGSYFSGFNTQSLQLSNVPSSWYGYKFRCIVNGNYSEEFTLKFTNSWVGTAGSGWENPANWSCNILPDANTDVVINNSTVILNSNTIVRSLTVNAGSNIIVGAGYQLTIAH